MDPGNPGKHITIGYGHGIGNHLESKKISDQHPTCGRLLANTGLPPQALISCDAANTSSIPAVWRMSAAQQGLSEMPALCSPVRCSRASADMGYPHMRVSS